MAHKVTLYMFTGSTPWLTARLMLEHKGVAYKQVHVLAGPHAFTMLQIDTWIAQGPPIAFSGWLELMSGFETIRDRADVNRQRG